MKNIAIDDSTHAKLISDAKAHNNAKLYAMVSAYQRGWELLSDEQRHQAITGRAASVGNLPEPEVVDEAITKLFRDAADLHQVFHAAVRDGHITEREAAGIRATLRKLVTHADGIAGATREMGRGTQAA